MSDDELLASAFRKILNPGRYSYLWISDPGLPPAITLDDTYTDRDGLTEVEVDAIRRAVVDVGA